MDPAAQAAPTPAASESAPVATPAPVTPEPALSTPTPEEAAQAAEDKEWEDAANELYPGQKQEEKSGEPKKTPEEIAADEAAAKGEKQDEEPGPSDDPSKEAATNPANSEAAARDARMAARQSAQQAETVKSDIREKMFAEVPQQLQDAQGDPIKTIEDVMGLVNPRTGEAFTEEEAGMWLLSAQQQFNQNLASVERQIEQIADLNMDIKDQADAIKDKYGEFLKNNIELRDEIWTDYEATLVKDPSSGIIVKAPVSLERFYERALKPYAAAAEREAKIAMATPPAPTTPPVEPAQPPATPPQSRQQARADRSDIYAPNSTPPVDKEDAEWAEAAKAVFGDRK